MRIYKHYEFNNVNEFKLKMLEKYGTKIGLTLFVIVGYVFNQIKNGKKAFFTKKQIQKFLMEKVSINTIRKAKKILKIYFGIYQNKIERKSSRECKYEWIIERDYFEKNPKLELKEFWVDFGTLVFDPKFRIDKKSCPKLLKFRLKKYWFQNLSSFFNKNKKQKIEFSKTFELYSEKNELENTDLDFFENFNFNTM